MSEKREIITFRDMLSALLSLSDEQLNQPAIIHNKELVSAFVMYLEVLDEDIVLPPGRSDFAFAEKRSDLPKSIHEYKSELTSIAIPNGTVLLTANYQ